MYICLYTHLCVPDSVHSMHICWRYFYRWSTRAWDQRWYHARVDHTHLQHIHMCVCVCIHTRTHQASYIHGMCIAFIHTATEENCALDIKWHTHTGICLHDTCTLTNAAHIYVCVWICVCSLAYDYISHARIQLLRISMCMHVCSCACASVCLCIHPCEAYKSIEAHACIPLVYMCMCAYTHG